MVKLINVVVSWKLKLRSFRVSLEGVHLVFVFRYTLLIGFQTPTSKLVLSKIKVISRNSKSILVFTYANFCLFICFFLFFHFYQKFIIHEKKRSSMIEKGARSNFHYVECIVIYRISTNL